MCKHKEKQNSFPRILNSSDKTFEEVLELLSNNRIGKLNMSQCPLNENNMASLAQILKANTSLTKLRFNHSYLQDKEVSILFGNLYGDPACVNSTLMEIDFSNCNIVNEDGCIAKYLETNQSLRYLSFRNNDISCHGAVSLAEP